MGDKAPLSISVDLEDDDIAQNPKPKSKFYKTNNSTFSYKNPRSFFFVETSRVVVPGTTGSQPPEFVLGYTRNIYNWVKNYKSDNAGYLLILCFDGPFADDAGREFWRALQDLPEISQAKIGVASVTTHKHTFPRFRIRASILAGLIAGAVANTKNALVTPPPTIVTDLPEFMVG